jgi:hypothetical protein
MVCNRSATDWYVGLVMATQHARYITFCYFAPGLAGESMTKTHSDSYTELLCG